jgi:uncharacterized protein (DUF58 family)
VLVLPEAHRLRPELVADVPGQDESVARRPVLAEERRDVMRALRDYRPGDHPRSIHWRTSARRGELVVKEFERTEPRRSLVVLDAAALGVEREREAVIEAAVELAASVLAELCSQGETVALAALGPKPLLVEGQGHEGLARGLDALARLEPPGSEDLSELARAVQRIGRRSRVIVVSTRPAAAVRRGLGDVVERARILVVERPEDALACYAEPRSPGAAEPEATQASERSEPTSRGTSGAEPPRTGAGSAAAWA